MDARLASFSDAEIDAEWSARLHAGIEARKESDDAMYEARAQNALARALAALGAPLDLEEDPEGALVRILRAAGEINEAKADQPLVVLCSAFHEWTTRDPEFPQQHRTHPHSVIGYQSALLCRAAIMLAAGDVIVSYSTDAGEAAYIAGGHDLAKIAEREQAIERDVIGVRLAKKQAAAAEGTEP